ncbi:ATP-binding protein [Rhodopirellula sp. MGV]|uniref:hybrid sensor histidine kinase/response regulator n=1 Tax=Rhodopirellula sp. MGV TaxID=2023130 RepID=UPI0013046F23|nr:ATP-binding protein [Rhodopirellula sp. MGV]
MNKPISDEGSRFRRILVIDDNEAIHGDFDKILRSDARNESLDELDAELFGRKGNVQKLFDFDLVHATQGQEGLQLLETALKDEEPFSVAFVDMRMPPGWDGVETIQRLWQADEKLQVVICTAYSDHSWQRIVERLGHNDRLLVLKKPFDEIEVVQLATSLCEKRRLLEISLTRMENLEKAFTAQAAELQEAQENAETLIQSITSILISLDSTGLVSRWNPIAEHVFKIREAQALGKFFSELPIRWVDPLSTAHLILERSSHGPCRSELHFIDNENNRKTLETSVFPVIDAANSHSRLILANDVTLQKKLQSQLDQAQRLESVGQLAAGVAHEINTPMQYIGDNIRYVEKTLSRFNSLLECLPDLIDESISDDEIIARRKTLAKDITAKKLGYWLTQLPEALSDSIQGVDAVAKIVSAMKELSHPGTAEKSYIDLNHILQSTITVARNEWKHIADVQTNFSTDMPDLLAFPSELNQAFLNIIVNAIHAIQDRIACTGIERGKIEISTSHDANNAVVVIADNGGGIPSEIRDRVFEPFFTTKDVGKGTGQGLALARAVVVNKHAGELTFDVREGEGTTFYIRLPFIADDEANELDVVVAANGGAL